VAQRVWQIGFGLWRLIRAGLNPVQALGQETSSNFTGEAAKVLSYRLQAYATRLLVLEVGRAAIDLYAGRLRLSDSELAAAQAQDTALSPMQSPPVRVVLVGQVNAGKSSLANALAGEVRNPVGPTPTASDASEHPIQLPGRPSINLVDLPGFAGKPSAKQLIAQIQRADLVLWVASATQPAREPDRLALDLVRRWANEPQVQRPPTILLALTHVDELRPQGLWAPPYDIAASDDPKALSIKAALAATANALAFPVEHIIPVAVPPDQPRYNVEAVWSGIESNLERAKLVQVDRIRRHQNGLDPRTVARQLSSTGRRFFKALVTTSSKPRA
jgi:predicted GTPase